jgi:predicted transcriptional regulator
LKVELERAKFRRAVQVYLIEQTLLPGSTKRLARRLNTSIAVISNYKHGHGGMSVEWARRVMQTLGDL